MSLIHSAGEERSETQQVTMVERCSTCKEQTEQLFKTLQVEAGVESLDANFVEAEKFKSIKGYFTQLINCGIGWHDAML